MQESVKITCLAGLGYILTIEKNKNDFNAPLLASAELLKNFLNGYFSRQK